ncbi:LPS-induced tumor necrosis factor alpha factor [Penicillium cf. griseofulvum]|uniref:LPS-induced tumor necrosis factor alpha factor n=1 Tax=Penicillium cf. griseofulvum TaxID=2972120 RepID=A0A9W9MZI5_9EURO|nr:LPS-induced tumor necrosis factor alpha factor [Penicillium cf. griseofulvum]KAJ5421494.1 LPS-induced tumor necrosis factor alpha factor [Penicillium cf. griseofulvum]KAJ5424726.1 LPS-induced tumor necrosis factor alpha factor [Penicillium cf. griseofulvum]
MEYTKVSTVPIPTVTAAESTTDSTVVTTIVPKTAPTDGTPSPTALPTMPEATPTPEPTTTTTGTFPVSEPMAIIPAESGPPPQYDDHKSDAITTPAPAVTSLQTEKDIPTGVQVPVAQRVIPLAQLGEEPGRICCPFCFHEVQTRVNKESTSATSMAAICCCLFGGLCCAFLPYCMQMCHDSHHFCTNCGVQVAIHPHDGPVQQFGPDSPGAIIQAPGRIEPPQAVMKN